MRHLGRAIPEELNFLLTNRVPRRLITRAAGWYAGIRSRALTRVSVSVWQHFGGSLHLEEAVPREYLTLRDVFTRQLKPGARPIDVAPQVRVSPCDGEVMACGRIDAGTLVQAKGLHYRLDELVGDPKLAAHHHDGTFVTLRLRSTFYHRFHAPCDATLEVVRVIAGDTWNVNPITVRRLENLYCRNARAILTLRSTHAPDERLTLVAVAAILVSDVRLTHLGGARPSGEPLRHPISVHRGDELGWFENGSTIVVLASPGLLPAPAVREGALIRVGEPLLLQADTPAPHSSAHVHDHA
ncbi:MAG: phosphatidylserine decarboxylase [Gemmatimonadetes bacterium]|nr:phosphatidylserine decarboxylase [Gemmatimonadota bacterium]